MPTNFTPEQVKDIQEREAKALAYLKELQLTPAAQLSKISLGNDVFADKVVCYLNDTKYSSVPSTNPEVNPVA